MSTLADELLNDFEESGSEGEGEEQNGFLQDGTSPPQTKDADTNGSMVLDGDEEDVGDEDETMKEGDQVAGAEDEEEAKAKVEKMQLGGVSDVRNVAGLMKTLEPVLEVSIFHLPFAHVHTMETAFTSPEDIALTFFVASRKSPTIKICLPTSRQHLSAR